MSNRLFQGIIHQMRDAVDRIIGVVDDNGVIIACSELVKIGEMRQGVRDELAYTSDAITSGGYTYKPIGSGSKWEYIVFIEGEDKFAEKMATVLAVSLSNIKNLYDEKYDTVIRGIDWTMGKTGALTPTAMFDTVEIDGTDVCRASLHNLTIMKQLNVRKDYNNKITTQGG